jgi:hypothetical protein
VKFIISISCCSDLDVFLNFIQSREENVSIPLSVLYGLADPGLVFEKYVNGTADYYCIRRGASRVVRSLIFFVFP